MPSGSSRYQGFHGTFQKTGVPPDAYQSAMDSNVAKEQNRDGGKSRGGLPKHLQDQHGTSSKSDPKLCSPSPGGIYPSSYPIALGRLQHLLPSQSDNPSGREESGTPSREKNQNKPMSVQEQDLRSLAPPQGLYRPPSEERLSPGQQPPSPCVKGSQRVVTLAQHISEVIVKDYTRQSQQQQSYHGSPVLDLTRPPSASQPPPTSQESAQGTRYSEGFGGECNRDKSSKSSGRSNGRKAKSPGPGLSGSERPSSVSSVHSEGDCNRRTPLTNRVWEDRPLSAGSTPTPFPCNPLTMRYSSGTVSAHSPSSGQQGGLGPGPGRSWEEEPKPLLVSQYETLSDSE
ncbi:hypothetical protein GOODEAATRI_006989 [Goodea atripinnis]|uniref:Nuclear receptor corepressor 2 n=1 Tax=Goodea atripinnis TaxID=208336 RepID=A0ABV0MFR9_9TELE